LAKRPTRLRKNETGQGAPSRRAGGVPVVVGRQSGQRGRKMDRLWKIFQDDEVDGIVFWPVIIIMLIVLIPIVMEIR
jgi:hypothetical protein